MDNLDVCISCEKRIEKFEGVGFGSITLDGQSIKTNPARFCTIDCTIEWLIKLDELQPKDDVNQIQA
jgi:hypothetical protein